MNNIDIITSNPKYLEYVRKIEVFEKERIFFKHTIEHFLDVARISYIQVLENNMKYSKEVIYAIALLHDIGRVLEYEKGTPHHEGSVILSKEILESTNFSEEEKKEILKAIKNHRKDSEDELSKLIYTSDKLSRNCFNCKGKEKCYWDENKKNYTIKF